MSETPNAQTDGGSDRRVLIHPIRLFLRLASIVLVLITVGCSRPVPEVVEPWQRPEGDSADLHHSDDGVKVDQKGAADEFRNRLCGTWVVSKDSRGPDDWETNEPAPSFHILEMELEIAPPGVVRWKQRFPAETEPLQKFCNRWLVQTGAIEEPIDPPPQRQPGDGLSASVRFKGITLLRYDPIERKYASSEIKDLQIVLHSGGLRLRAFMADGLQKFWRFRRGPGVGRGAECTPEDRNEESQALLPRLTKNSGRSTLGGLWPEAAAVERDYHSRWSKEGQQSKQPTAYIRGKAVVVRDWKTDTTPPRTALDLPGMLLLPPELRAAEANELGTVIRILAEREYTGTYQIHIGTYVGPSVNTYRETWVLQIIDLRAEKMIADVPFVSRSGTTNVQDRSSKGEVVYGPNIDEVKDYLRRLTRLPR